MKEFKIKTWSCVCGYRQDFEPTKEKMAIHFPGLSSNKCPSCHEHDLKKEKDDKRKCKMVYCEEEDKVALEAKLLAKESKEGETDSQKAKRIKDVLDEMKIPSSEEVRRLREKYEDV